MMQEINKSIYNTVTTMEQSNNSTQEIAKASLEISHTANAINELAQKMADNAEELNNLVAQFKL